MTARSELVDRLRAGERALDIVGIGEAMIELWATVPLGEARSLQRAYGGDVLNTLVVAARLGAKTGFVSKVGSDPFGPALLSEWQREGIDVHSCPLVPGTNGVYFISLLSGGEREFSYYRRGSAASTLSPTDLDHSYLAQARIVLLSGITQAISESAQETTLAAARIARENGVAVAFDPNYRPALWKQRAEWAGLNPGAGLSLARAAVRELTPFVDILLPSFPSDARLWGDLGLSPRRFAGECRASGARSVGMKLGPSGAFVAAEDREERIDEVVVDDVVDSTGAGDAWNAAFLGSMLRGADPFDAAAYGNLLAAWKLGFRGAVPPVDARPPRALRERV